MKRLFVLIAVSLVFASCTTQNENDRFFCKKLGFDMEDEKIYVTAQLASPGKSTPENGKDKIIVRVADSTDRAVEMLEAEFDTILFKPLECIIFGQGMDEETVHELAVRMANRVELQLKCDIYRVPSAKEAIMNESGADENEGVSFSRFFRNMTGGMHDEKK